MLFFCFLFFFFDLTIFFLLLLCFFSCCAWVLRRFFVCLSCLCDASLGFSFGPAMCGFFFFFFEPFFPRVLSVSRWLSHFAPSSFFVALSSVHVVFVSFFFFFPSLFLGLVARLTFLRALPGIVCDCFCLAAYSSDSCRCPPFSTLPILLFRVLVYFPLLSSVFHFSFPGWLTFAVSSVVFLHLLSCPLFCKPSLCAVRFFPLSVPAFMLRFRLVVYPIRVPPLTLLCWSPSDFGAAFALLLAFCLPCFISFRLLLFSGEAEATCLSCCCLCPLRFC